MYRFVKVKWNNLDYKRWYLYCDSLDVMREHMEKYVKMDIATGFRDKIEHPHNHSSSNWRSGIELIQQVHGKSFFDASVQLENTMLQNKIKSLLNNKVLLLTSECTYMELIDEMEIVESVYMDEMIFPQYNKSDIRVLQWAGGNHYYAKIGRMDVVYNNQQKWDTYDEAKYYADLFYEDCLRNTSVKHDFSLTR